MRGAGFRLADAQSVVARQTGFASWPALSRHVQQLRALEGDWRFVSLEIDGAAMPAESMTHARLLIDGDRFRMESPEATYEGIFTIDVEATPPTIDIEFVEGPDAGNWSYGLFELAGDQLTFCLSLGGATRPQAFATSQGSGHALERLRRASADRPADVTGGTRQPPPPAIEEEIDPSRFDVEMTPLLRRLEGEWVPVELIRDGKAMTDQWLAYRLANVDRQRGQSRVWRTGHRARENADRRTHDAHDGRVPQPGSPCRQDQPRDHGLGRR